MIWLAIVALGNMGVAIWLVRENRRLTQMVVSKHTGDFTAMVRAERQPVVNKKTKSDDDDNYHTWRSSAEGVAP
jgi:hypothetical protein